MLLWLLVEQDIAGHAGCRKPLENSLHMWYTHIVGGSCFRLCHVNSLRKSIAGRVASLQLCTLRKVVSEGGALSSLGSILYFGILSSYLCYIASPSLLIQLQQIH